MAMAQKSVEQGRYREAIVEMRNLLLENKSNVDVRSIPGAAFTTDAQTVHERASIEYLAIGVQSEGRRNSQCRQCPRCQES